VTGFSLEIILLFTREDLGRGPCPWTGALRGSWPISIHPQDSEEDGAGFRDAGAVLVSVGRPWRPGSLGQKKGISTQERKKVVKKANGGRAYVKQTHKPEARRVVQWQTKKTRSVERWGINRRRNQKGARIGTSPKTINGGEGERRGGISDLGAVDKAYRRGTRTRKGDVCTWGSGTFTCETIRDKNSVPNFGLPSPSGYCSFRELTSSPNHGKKRCLYPGRITLVMGSLDGGG